jgi:hypothetical protein
MDRVDAFKFVLVSKDTLCSKRLLVFLNVKILNLNLF